ncbi:hypothetical protein RND71_016953 [Anisodus tanguticus]|uniref:Uncharacterized protein n=1 Tax=Anisodus tanguticus TaxID=243964 RepID=A0AAE1S2X4_9SOLA|nr:hypothetical protein RND71_016953 [Anisodus tanguticus]
MTMTGPSDTPVTMQLNHQTDLEAGSPHLEADGASSPQHHFSDPFDIANTKKASFQALKRWRLASVTRDHNLSALQQYGGVS